MFISRGEGYFTVSKEHLGILAFKGGPFYTVRDLWGGGRKVNVARWDLYPPPSCPPLIWGNLRAFHGSLPRRLSPSSFPCSRFSFLFVSRHISFTPRSLLAVLSVGLVLNWKREFPFALLFNRGPDRRVPGVCFMLLLRVLVVHADRPRGLWLLIIRKRTRGCQSVEEFFSS